MEEFKPTDDLIKQTADLYLSMPYVSRMPENSPIGQNTFFPNTVKVAAGEILKIHDIDTMANLGIVKVLERATKEKYRRTKKLHLEDKRRKQIARIFNAEHQQLDPKE